MRKTLLSLTVALSALALAACGGGGSSSSSSSSSAAGGGAASGGGAQQAAGGGGGQTVSIAADPSGALKFDTTKLTAKAGTATFKFTNQSSLQHDFTIETQGGQKVDATPLIQGSSASFTTKLKPGSYKFLCTVPGHAQAGMQGTLTVK